MKALSITEPYATLIRDGVKRIETRSWKTKYRGDLLIHASSTKIPKEYRKNEDLMNLVGDRPLHFGQIVAKCKLIDCVPITEEFIKSLKRDEIVSGFYSEGRYAWILDDVEVVNEKQIVKGNLGLWSFDGFDS